MVFLLGLECKLQKSKVIVYAVFYIAFSLLNTFHVVNNKYMLYRYFKQFTWFTLQIVSL